MQLSQSDFVRGVVVVMQVVQMRGPKRIVVSGTGLTIVPSNLVTAYQPDRDLDFPW